MVLRKRHEEYNSSNVQECSEYAPIQAAKMIPLEFGTEEMDDAGCDSCTHYHNGECGVFRSNNKGESDY
jgi:hypothetical protein